jgi:hypothetical protein
MSTKSTSKKAYLVREVPNTLPGYWKQSVVQVFPDLEQARAAQQRLTQTSATTYEIEEIEASAAGPAPDKPSRRTVYVVQQLYWEYNDNWHDLKDDEPLRAFTDPELAEVYRLEREEAARVVQGNPLRLAGGSRASSLTEEQLVDRLASLGLDPPPALDFWDDDWWNELQQRSVRVFHQVWDLFDRVRFHEVVPTDLGP